jgi:hypothetical protein
MTRFISQAQKDCYKQCARIMVAVFGDAVQASMDAPEFSVAAGSARVDVIVTPWRDTAIVAAMAVVVQKPAIDYDLRAFLLAENLQFDLGGFGINQQGDVVFKHATIGTALSEDSLRASVQTVMLIADQYDDRIQARWGGQRATDSRPSRPQPHRRQLRVKMQTGADAVDETVKYDSDEIGER